MPKLTYGECFNMKVQDITFVVQGPVQATPDREQQQGITEQCLLSI